MKNNKTIRRILVVLAGIVAVTAIVYAAFSVQRYFLSSTEDLKTVGGKTMPVRILWQERFESDVIAKLSEDFTKETGIPVIVEQVSIPRWQEISYQELASGFPRFDLLVGDSQWNGYAVENGYYEDLTSFFDEHKILGTFSESSTRGYGEYPEDSEKYYSVPLNANTNVYAYRTDWFADPVEQAAFKEQYGRELSVPRTYEELRDIAKFFYRPEENRYGIVFPVSSSYDVVTMVFGSMLFGYGGSWGNRVTCVADGHINNNGAVIALELYRELYQYTPPGMSNSLYAQAWNRFFEGDVALGMNFITNLDNNPIATSTGYFSGLFGPASRDAQLVGQGVSLVQGARNRDGALKFLEWWIRYETQQAFAEGNGLTTFRRVTTSQSFRDLNPYNEAYAVSIEHVRDFWNTPRYAELLDISQRHFYNYLTSANAASARETLEMILSEWRPILAHECNQQ